MCDKGKKDQTASPPTLHLSGSLFSSWVCQLCQFVSYMKLTFMRVIVIVVVIAIVVNAPGQELPYLHSLSLHSLFSALHSPLADWHWESVSITWPNNNLMQHWLFSLPIFNFPFYSFILLLFFYFFFLPLLLLSVCPCVPSAIVSGCLRCPLATLGPFWPLFTQLVSLLLQFLQFMARFALRSIAGGCRCPLLLLSLLFAFFIDNFLEGFIWACHSGPQNSGAAAPLTSSHKN